MSADERAGMEVSPTKKHEAGKSSIPEWPFKGRYLGRQRNGQKANQPYPNTVEGPKEKKQRNERTIPSIDLKESLTKRTTNAARS